MVVFSRGKKFWCRFSHNGCQYRRPTGEKTKTAAMARAFEIYKAVCDGDPLPEKPVPVPTLKEFAEGYFTEWVKQSSKLKEKTRESYLYGLMLLRKQTIWAMRIDRIRTEDIDMISVPGSPSTHNCALRTLRRLLHIAESQEHIRRVPKVHLLEEVVRSRMIDP